MKVITDVGEMLIPMHPREILLKKWTEFQSFEQEYFREQREGNIGEHQSIHLINCVSSIIPDFAEKEIPYSLIGDLPMNMLKDGYKLQIGDELSVERLYVHIVNTVDQYEGDKLINDMELKEGQSISKGKASFDWDGETYYVLANDFIVSADQLLRTYSSSEIIMSMEMQRRFDNAKASSHGKELADLFFELGVTQVALLARKKGEHIPLNERVREVWKEHRKSRFENITLDIQLQLDFFFRYTYLRFIQEESLKSSPKNSQGITLKKKVTILSFVEG